MALYEFNVLGKPSVEQLRELKAFVSTAVGYFGWHLDKEIAWQEPPSCNGPPPPSNAAAVFYGGAGSLSDSQVIAWQRHGVPIVPVASDLTQVPQQIPEPLQNLNCFGYSKHGTPRVAASLLECAGILPKRRRVFISYIRKEAQRAALQLFAELSGRQFDVFLDTHRRGLQGRAAA